MSTNTLLLFIAILGGVFFLGIFGYRSFNDFTANNVPANPSLPETNPKAQPVREEQPLPAQTATNQVSPAPTPPATPAQAIGEDEQPKAPSASEENFESEDDSVDTDDSVSVEVEPDDE